MEVGPSSSRSRILVVDDTPEVRMVIESALQKAGFDVQCVDTGAKCLTQVQEWQPDVVILDVMLPDTTGIAVCQRLRSNGIDVFILMLTAQDEETDKLVGLAAGADDYLTKPFSPREVAARMHALLRRRPSSPIPLENEADLQNSLRHGNIEMDLESREVKLDGNLVTLTRIEFELLATLISRPRMVFTRNQLIERVWGNDWFGDPHVVDVHLSNARIKLGSSSIMTVRGVGYRMGDIS